VRVAEYLASERSELVVVFFWSKGILPLSWLILDCVGRDALPPIVSVAELEYPRGISLNFPIS
jgi:hypothetical protein